MENLVIIRTAEGVKDLINYLADKDYVAFDTETDGVFEEARIIGMSVCAEESVGYYVITKEWDTTTNTLVDLGLTESAISLVTALKPLNLIMHNAGFDCARVKHNYGVELMPLVHTDTMILAHIVDENRPVGLKDLGTSMFGEDSRKEQSEMRESVTKNGGVLTRDKYELYKADSELVARYGAKDAILTLKIFNALIPELYAQGMDKFFYDDESMPLLRGPTYDLNTTGLRIDPVKLQKLKGELEADCLEAKAFIYKEIEKHITSNYRIKEIPYIKESAPVKSIQAMLFNRTVEQVGKKKKTIVYNGLTTQGRQLCADLNVEIPADIDSQAVSRAFEQLVVSTYKEFYAIPAFNIDSYKQLSWLLYFKLGHDFNVLTDEGKEVCFALHLKIPYSNKAKREFIEACIDNKGMIYAPGKYDYKTGKKGRPKVIQEPWHYVAADKHSLAKLAPRYKWLQKLLEYFKNQKMLGTYVEGIQERMQYNVIHPSFLQHGTTSGRYSAKNPNFQNLPRDDKRIKACVVSRPGKLFVGADYSQLEPRVFASFSGDKRLQDCFRNGDDFYSVTGVEIFDKQGCSLKKNDDKSFAKLHPKLRDISKAVTLSATYGTTAWKLAMLLGIPSDEAQSIIDSYFDKFGSVLVLMLDSHEQAKTNGYVDNLFGRRRRIPKALNIKKLFGNAPHGELEYEYRNLLNLAINHRIQSTGASIMNRAAIAVSKTFRDLAVDDPRWNEAKIVMQVHDELILEVPAALAEQAAAILKHCMENTVVLPGVDLIAEPKIANNLADLK